MKPLQNRSPPVCFRVSGFKNIAKSQNECIILMDALLASVSPNDFRYGLIMKSTVIQPSPVSTEEQFHGHLLV
ncbi:unnamed protein product [Caenorhabditis nigoni]